MGKKRIIQKTEKELIEEREKVEAAVKKEAKIQPSKKVKEGRVCIASSYNNTIISLTDLEGNILTIIPLLRISSIFFGSVIIFIKVIIREIGKINNS